MRDINKEEARSNKYIFVSSGESVEVKKLYDNNVVIVEDDARVVVDVVTGSPLFILKGKKSYLEVIRSNKALNIICGECDFQVSPPPNIEVNTTKVLDTSLWEEICNLYYKLSNIKGNYDFVEMSLEDALSEVSDAGRNLWMNALFLRETTGYDIIETSINNLLSMEKIQKEELVKSLSLQELQEYVDNKSKISLIKDVPEEELKEILNTTREQVEQATSINSEIKEMTEDIPLEHLKELTDTYKKYHEQIIKGETRIVSPMVFDKDRKNVLEQAKHGIRFIIEKKGERLCALVPYADAGSEKRGISQEEKDKLDKVNDYSLQELDNLDTSVPLNFRTMRAEDLLGVMP